MQLNIVSARTGLTWVKLGVKTFLKQPLALSGLFLMFMALLSIASLIPLLGAALALALLPACTLGLMAATREAEKGHFPMPLILLSAFRAGKDRFQAMALLGGLYAAGFLTIMAISVLVDGGQFAKLYLVGGKLTEELVLKADFQAAMWVTLSLYLPLSLMFWHAPALVHWHGLSPIKSLFFSFMACYKNFLAMTVYALVWSAAFVLTMLVVTITAALLGNPVFAAVGMLPLALILFSMFFTSVYFSYRDSFIATPAPESLNQALEFTVSKKDPP